MKSLKFSPLTATFIKVQPAPNASHTHTFTVQHELGCCLFGASMLLMPLLDLKQPGMEERKEVLLSLRRAAKREGDEEKTEGQRHRK